MPIVYWQRVTQVVTFWSMFLIFDKKMTDEPLINFPFRSGRYLQIPPFPARCPGSRGTSPSFPVPIAPACRCAPDLAAHPVKDHTLPVNGCYTVFCLHYRGSPPFRFGSHFQSTRSHLTAHLVCPPVLHVNNESCHSLFSFSIICDICVGSTVSRLLTT